MFGEEAAKDTATLGHMPLDPTIHIHQYELTGESRRKRIGAPPACMEYQRACACGDDLWTEWHLLGPVLQKAVS